MPIVAAAPEAVGQDPALRDGGELILDELRQVGTGRVFGLGEAGRGGLPANALHARLPKW